jgi:hypothetical protein
LLRRSSIRTLRDSILSLLVALCTGAAGATTTTTVVTTITTTTLPPTPPSALCTCQSGVCEVVAGSYAVNPGSVLAFGTCALTIDSGATIQLTTAGPAVIEAPGLTMNPNAVIRGAPATQAPNDGGSIFINVSGDILLAAGATINVDAQDAAASEIDLTAGATITLEGGADATALSANAGAADGGGGTINLMASGNVSIGASLSAAGGPMGAGGSILITTNNAKVTVNAPLDASGGELDGGSIDVESDLDLVTTSAAKLVVDGGGSAGSGGQITLISNVQGSVTIGGPISGNAGGSDQGGELDSSTNAGSITLNAGVDLSGGAGGGAGGTVDLEPAGDLIVNAALNLAGHGVGSCGGSATLGSDSGNVMLSSNPIDVSGDSCGMGQVVVTATETAVAPGEIIADSNGTTAGGGMIQLTAATLKVGGTLHANGGGGEVNLQACSLTLTATGQAGATGPNGFNLLQASGPMEIDGTLTATTANTLDYLDPAEPPVVHSNSIVPPAVIVLNTPPVPSLCSSETPTTTSTLAVTTTTMAPPTGSCSPPSCDDRGVCMPGACVDGHCEYMALTGVECATAALGAIKSLVDASPTAFSNKVIRRKVLGRLAHLGHLVDNAGGQGGRAAKAKRKAANAFGGLGTFVTKAAGRHKVDGTLAESLKTLTQDASSALER